ncbi:MAG: DNA (cytosine-5-)-methyltransferase [Clostridia bacterium]|jgi:DNA (cytosine-5)-methyltransferase 1
MGKEINVVELFAGVGGFRFALEKSSDRYKTIWANQWEPGKKMQHAFDCYVANFGNNANCINKDIAIVKQDIPEHHLLVGGFPCQDYSVARTGACGIEGKKGVLWWEIRDIIEEKRPPYILLENVDRILKSPAKQRGRDFGIILRCLNELGYAAEWRVINAAEYGHPQKRRRTFIFAVNKSSSTYSKYIKNTKEELIQNKGFFANAFPIEVNNLPGVKHISWDIGKKSYSDLISFSNKFACDFANAGVMVKNEVYTYKVYPKYLGKKMLLMDVLEKENIDDKYFLGETLDKWLYMKGSKREIRIKPNGEEYNYTEGAIPFPDNLDTPARTILTSESSVNRSTHVIKAPASKKYRLLTPIECERLNEFPDNWTNTGMPEKFRYFVMGNALVTGVVKTLADTLIDYIDD